LEFTPNPDSLKYVVNRSILLKGSRDYTNAEAAKSESRLATLLFGIENVSGVMLGTNFVTVTISNQDRLTQTNEILLSSIRKFFESDQLAIEPSAVQVNSNPANLSNIEKKIIQILDEEVRPAVAMDGGDITFEKYEDGIVFLKMQGACSGCPSSLMTLKMGVETRLKDAVPEIIEVIPV